jgi:hypothetical protein
MIDDLHVIEREVYGVGNEPDPPLWGVFDQNDECYAIREEHPQAFGALREAQTMLGEVAACGHPNAPAWAYGRMPLEVREVTDEEHEEILENGTPWLDREP